MISTLVVHSKKKKRNKNNKNISKKNERTCMDVKTKTVLEQDWEEIKTKKANKHSILTTKFYINHYHIITLHYFWVLFLHPSYTYVGLLYNSIAKIPCVCIFGIDTLPFQYKCSKVGRQLLETCQENSVERTRAEDKENSYGDC